MGGISSGVSSVIKSSSTLTNVTNKVKTTISNKVSEVKSSVSNKVNQVKGNLFGANKNSDYSKEFLEWLNKGDANNQVYFGIDESTNEAVYTGITRQAKNVRLNQHLSNGKPFVDLDTQFVDLTRNQARSIEQFFIENGPNKLNKINSISPNNKFYMDALDWASKYIGGK